MALLRWPDGQIESGRRWSTATQISVVQMLLRTQGQHPDTAPTTPDIVANPGDMALRVTCRSVVEWVRAGRDRSGLRLYGHGPASGG